MLRQSMNRGAQDALACLGIKTAESLGQAAIGQPTARMRGYSLGQTARGFLGGQLDAGKDLLSNLRGGLGGQLNPDVLPAPGGDVGATRAAHRARAIGNLKTLTPTLLAGGGLYYLHQRHQQAENQRRQQGMSQDGYGQSMM